MCFLALLVLVVAATYPPSGSSGSQTPWTGNIDGGGFNLLNAGKISTTGVTNSSLTASRLILTDANKAATSAAASGSSVAVAGDGSAITPSTGLALAGGNLTANTYETISLFAASSASPADSTTYYIGGDQGANNTSYPMVQVYLQKAGTIVAYSLKVVDAGTLGTTEAVPHMLRLNDTTDFGTTNITISAVQTNCTITGLSQAFSDNATIVLKISAPAWVTNPTTVRWRADILIRH